MQLKCFLRRRKILIVIIPNVGEDEVKLELLYNAAKRV
jgi:hypothetical protein